MAHPKKGYWFAGERLPGTTTIIGRFKDSGGLLHWAFQQGQNGASHLYEKADEAADIGTCTHSMIEAHINGGNPADVLHSMAADSESADKSHNAYTMYMKWENQTKIKFLTKYQEIQLVSPEFKFGGTPDAIGEIDGEIMLIDWKTSNGVYQDYIIQLAAYCHLINDGVRMDTGEPLPFKVVDGAHLCRFPKEFADFDHRYFGGLSDAWEQFKLFRQAYTIDKRLKKRAA
jgi:hypothetical protein